MLFNTDCRLVRCGRPPCSNSFVPLGKCCRECPATPTPPTSPTPPSKLYSKANLMLLCFKHLQPVPSRDKCIKSVVLLALQHAPILHLSALFNVRLDACVQLEQSLTQSRMSVFHNPSAHVHRHVHEITAERILKASAQSKFLVISSFISHSTNAFFIFQYRSS